MLSISIYPSNFKIISLNFFFITTCLTKIKTHLSVYFRIQLNYCMILILQLYLYKKLLSLQDKGNREQWQTFVKSFKKYEQSF